MATTITGSPYISILDSKIIADACAGNFIIDVTPSTFTAGGAVYVKGASVKITNPIGVVIRNYITSGYDIVPPMTGSVSIPIPLVATNYLYGDYTVTVKLTDASGTEYFITKQVSLCPADSKNKTKKQGCLSATISGSCKEGKVIILLNEVPTYKGIVSSSQVNTLKVDYPTASGLVALTTTMASFSVILFEGVYKVTGTVCATYNYGDNVFFKVQYKVDCEKKVICKIDKACIQDKIDELNARYNSDCTDDEKAETASIILQTLFLLEAADNAAEIGNDPSDYIAELEALLGCSCSCNCNEGTPYIDNTPATDYSFAGCGFTNTVVGLTRVITLNNYRYELVNAAGSALSIGAPVVDAGGCIVTQTITFDSTTLCSLIGQTFIATAGQKNGVINTAYGFLISGTAGCQKIFAPTGFGITGERRKSAYGKTEWFDTLTLANADAGAQETVLIFTDTIENLVLKSNVSYQGVGLHSVGNISTAVGITGNINLSNIKTPEIAITGSGNILSPTNYTATNFIVTGISVFTGHLKWEGGNFTGETTAAVVPMSILSFANVTKIYSKVKLSLFDNGTLTHSVINDTSLGSVYNVIYINNTATPNSVCTLSHCYITSINNSGVECLSTDNTCTNIITNNVIKTGVRFGLRIHGGNVASAVTSVCTNNFVTNIGDNVGLIPNGAIVLYNTANITTPAVVNIQNYFAVNNVGYSVNGPGIVSVLGSMKGCHGYSVNAAGILVSSQENQATNLYIADCTGDSKNSFGLDAQRDVFIVGGTYSSRGIGANGNPIRISRNLQASLNNYKYVVSGVNTIASDIASYAINGSSPITVRISNCNFHNENNTGTVLGIHTVALGGNITLVAVTTDIYGNIS